MSQAEPASRAELLPIPPDLGPKLELVDTGPEQIDQAAATPESPAAAPWESPWRPSLGELSRSERSGPSLRLGLDPRRRRRVGQLFLVVGALLILAGLLAVLV